MVAWRSAPLNHADQADIDRQSLRLFRPRGFSATPLGSTDYFHFIRGIDQMNELFGEYCPLSKNAVQQIWETALVIPDANSLLNFIS